MAASGLSACQTNVGAAAFVGPTRISASDVNRYLAPQAALYSETGADGAVTTLNPKSVVLRVLIDRRIFAALFVNTPGGAPSAGALSAARNEVLARQGGSDARLRQNLKASGYQPAFADVVLNYLAEFGLAESALKDVGDGAAVLAAIAKLHLSVRVNPMYGSWQAAGVTVVNGPLLPSFLTIMSGARASSSAATSG